MDEIINENMVDYTEDNTGKIDHMYSDSESLFGGVCNEVRKNGWAVLPQSRVGKRLPSVIDGAAIKWKKYIDKAPTIEETRNWGVQARTENAAILLGAVSNNVWALDIDVTDPELATEIRELAREILGHTPFQRQGMAPKIAIFYRSEKAEDIPRYANLRFMEKDLKSISDNAIEILGNGRMITAYGYHHKTQRYFRWRSAQPVSHQTEKVPLVTNEQLEKFIDAVQDIRPLHNNMSAAAANTEWETVETKGIVIPKLKSMGAQSDWAENSQGLVADGRESYLWNLCRQTVRMNAGLIADNDGIKKIRSMIMEEFKKSAVMSGRWTESYLRNEIIEKVNRSVADIKSGRVAPWKPKTKRETFTPTERAESKPVKKTRATKGDPLGYLPEVNNKVSVTSRQSRAVISPYAIIQDGPAGAEEQRKLVPNRKNIAQDVQKKLTDALDTFFEQVYNKSPETVTPIHVLKAPTGAGKTTRTMRYIAEDPRTKKWDQEVEDGQEYPGPILFLLPTYNNIQELRNRAEVLNLDASLSDEDLGKQAQEQGLVSAENLETQLADLRRDAMNAGIRTMIYKGKVAAGCKMEEKVKMLMSAGIGTSGLCKAKVKSKDGEVDEVYCTHHSSCPAIQQRKKIEECHVVFLPHAFLTLNIPEELQKVRAVIADERIFTMFVHTTTFSLNTLRRPRKAPRLTKKEREMDMSPDEFLQARDQAAEIAENALTSGRCPAEVLSKFREEEMTSKGKIVTTGIDLVRNAVRVCGNAISADANINPDMSSEEINELCSKPTGTQVREEYRFWKIIEERIEALLPDTVLSSLSGGESPIKKKAFGNREMRIQYLKEENADGHRNELIRLSWRTQPNWPNAPLLLLDASASPVIISKIFDSREVVVHDIDAPLNVMTVLVVDRTYSNAAIVAKIGGFKERMAAGKLKDKMQKVISASSALYGYGRVVCGSSVAVRRAINTEWLSPSNIDFCHYGATRGLDFAKYHSAAVSFGRMEVPTATIDGIVAALTYDDAVPEEPFDRNGDGVDHDGKPLILPATEMTVPLRSGQDAKIAIPTYPGRLAKIVQMQYREEELRQFVGRLRPVYREGDAPVWIAVSKVIPDGIIVDEIITLDDLLKKSNKIVESWNAMRLADGVLTSDLACEVAPMTYSDASHWKDDMASLGLDEETPDLDPDNRFHWGLTPVRYKSVTGENRVGYVRSEIADPKTAFTNAYKKYLGVNVRILSVGKPCHEKRPGVAREEDWVAKDLGSARKRKSEEQQSLQEAATFAVQTLKPADIGGEGKRNALPRRITLKFQDGDKVDTLTMNVTELAAGRATDRMWKKIFTPQDAPGGDVMDPSLGEEQFGEGSLDEDGF